MNGTGDFSILESHQYMNLTTFRKNGEPKVTAVWFAAENGKIYVMTSANAWKVKRIKNNPQVEMAPCKQNGAPIGSEKAVGTARLLPPEEEDVARQALDKKYGLMKKILDLMGRARKSSRVHLEITPRSYG